MQRLIGLVERGLVPDALARMGIRRLLRKRLADETPQCEAASERFQALLDDMATSPLALSSATANAQHYELPAAFFERILGPQLKYSCCYYRTGSETLEQAEQDMLALTCERAGLANGQRVLELGCGWGALSLWIARHYPESTITVVSNSASQRAFIERRRDQRGITNLTVVTADMNDFDTSERFDRVVSLEMFEHMRNWRELFRRIHGWLVPGGLLFFHVFCHRQASYVFRTDGEDDWMGKYFFTDGLMPSASLPLYFQEHLRVRRHWRLDGRHYQHTCNHWLQNLDDARPALEPVLAEVYGADQVTCWVNRWRLFLLACSELFGYRGGQEWQVGHYVYERPLESSAC